MSHKKKRGGKWKSFLKMLMKTEHYKNDNENSAGAVKNRKINEGKDMKLNKQQLEQKKREEQQLEIERQEELKNELERVGNALIAAAKVGAVIGGEVISGQITLIDPKRMWVEIVLNFKGQSKNLRFRLGGSAFEAVGAKIDVLEEF